MHVLMALAALIMGRNLDLPPDEVSRRVEAECVDGRWGVDCPDLLEEVEVELYGDLHTLADLNSPLDREVLQAAAQAHFPPLADLGLRRMGQISNDADRDAVLAAIEHPSPGVRQAARTLLESADAQPAKAYTRWWRNSSSNGWDALVPDIAPMPEQLGMRDLADLRYRYFASDEHRAVFTSALSPDKLLGRIAPGAKTKTGEQVAKMAQKKKDMANGVDAATGAVEQTLSRSGLGALMGLAKRTSKEVEASGETKQTRSYEPVEEFSEDPAAVLYVQIDRPEGASPVQAAAGRDRVLGETVLVVRY